MKHILIILSSLLFIHTAQASRICQRINENIEICNDGTKKYTHGSSGVSTYSDGETSRTDMYGNTYYSDDRECFKFMDNFSMCN